MGYQLNPGDDWIPRRLQPWILGFPGMLLKLSLLWFLVGLVIEIWLSAKRMQFRWDTDEVKASCLHRSEYSDNLLTQGRLLHLWPQPLSLRLRSTQLL